MGQALAEAEGTAVVELRGSKEWRRALAFLGRRFRDRWGQRVEVTGADGAPVGPTLYRAGVKLPEEDEDD